MDLREFDNDPMTLRQVFSNPMEFILDCTGSKWDEDGMKSNKYGASLTTASKT